MKMTIINPEALGQPRLRPLPSRPLVALSEALLERRQREVEEDDEGELVREEVVGQVRARRVAGQDFVERVDRPEVEVGLLAEIAPQHREVPVDRLEREFHPREERVECLLIAGEVCAEELGELRLVAIGRPPELAHLRGAAREAVRLR